MPERVAPDDVRPGLLTRLAGALGLGRASPVRR